MGTVQGIRVSVDRGSTKLLNCLYRNVYGTSVTIAIVSTILKASNFALDRAVQALLNGDLVAFPTETVYGLGGDALNEKSIARIYKVKARPTNHPLIVHVSSIDKLDYWVSHLPEYALKLAESFWPGPMTLLLPKTKLVKEIITGGQDCIGIRVPNQPFTSSLLKDFESQGGLGVVAPSANRFGKVSPTSASDVEEELEKYLDKNDLIIDGGLCQVGLESTIIDCRLSNPKILRPGVITKELIETVARKDLIETEDEVEVRVSGLLKSHYSPKAKIFLHGSPNRGDGFIALNDVETPLGAIRLASPVDTTHYAQILYRALRLADQMQIDKVFVVPPFGDGLSIAIYDRLIRASFD